MNSIDNILKSNIFSIQYTEHQMARGPLLKKPRLSPWLVFLILLLVQGGCFWKKKTPENEQPAGVLYQKGLELIQKKKFEKAREAFNKVKVISKETNLELLAQIAVADSYFEENEYEAARAQYEDLFKLHSGGEIADYLQYRIGECYFWQMDTIDRDTTDAKEALKAYNLLAEKFPKSEYLPQAGLRIREIHAFLAESEFFIGDFYLRKNALFSAINRFKKALELYPESGIEDKLIFYLYKAYVSLKDHDHAEVYRKLLIERFPNSEYVPMIPSQEKQGLANGFEDPNETSVREPYFPTVGDSSLPAPSSRNAVKGDLREGLQKIALLDEPRPEEDRTPIGIAGTYQGKDMDSWYRRILFPDAGASDRSCSVPPGEPSPEEHEDLQKRSFFEKLIP